MPFTEAAIKKIQFLRSAYIAPPLGLRIAVKGGGCSGLTYEYSWVFEVNEKDKSFDVGDVKVFIDYKSLLYLKNCTLDFVDTLQKTGFVIINPEAKTVCGCGKSWS